MQLEGNYAFRAPVEAVWDALMDPGVLAQALPGGEQMVQVGENEYQAVMNVRVGPVQGRFEGRIELSDIVAPEHYRMKVSGQGAPGFVSGEGTLQLAPDGAAGATLTYAGDVQIGGKIAGISQRLVESSAKSLTRQGLQALDKQIQARLLGEPASLTSPLASPPPETRLPEPQEAGSAPWQPIRTASRAAPEPVVAGSSPAAHRDGPAPRLAAPSVSAAGVMATTMKDVARDLASDYVPPAQQDKALWAAIGALGMLLFVVLVRLVQKR